MSDRQSKNAKPREVNGQQSTKKKQKKKRVESHRINSNSREDLYRIKQNNLTRNQLHV